MRKDFKMHFEYNENEGLSLVVEGLNIESSVSVMRTKSLSITVKGCFSINSSISVAYPIPAVVPPRSLFLSDCLIRTSSGHSLSLFLDLKSPCTLEILQTNLMLYHFP